MSAWVLVVLSFAVGCRRESYVHDLTVLDDGSAVIASEGRNEDVSLSRITSDNRRIWVSKLAIADPLLISAGDLIFIHARNRDSTVLQAWESDTGKFRWQQAPLEMAGGLRMKVASASDRVVVTRDGEHQVAVLDRNTGTVIERHDAWRPADHVVRLGSRVFVGDTHLHVFEDGKRVLAIGGWGPGCVVGPDYVFAQRHEHGMHMVRFQGGDPKRSTVTELALSRTASIDACYPVNDHVVFAGRDYDNNTTHFWHVDAEGALVVHRVVSGRLRVEEVQASTEMAGVAGMTRYVPIAQVATREHVLLDLETLSVIARTSTDLDSELLRSGSHWYLITGSGLIGRIDGDRGVLTGAARVNGAWLEAPRVRVNGDAVWLYSRGWHDGLAVARLDAKTLVGTMVGADLAVVPTAAFLGLPR